MKKQNQNDYLQFNDMRMSEELEILYFSANFAHDIQTLDFLTIQNLHGDFVFR